MLKSARGELCQFFGMVIFMLARTGLEMRDYRLIYWFFLEPGNRN
jgi:hypothetical protein